MNNIKMHVRYCNAPFVVLGKAAHVADEEREEQTDGIGKQAAAPEVMAAEVAALMH